MLVKRKQFQHYDLKLQIKSKTKIDKKDPELIQRLPFPEFIYLTLSLLIRLVYQPTS